jgi:hypothetical protein
MLFDWHHLKNRKTDYLGHLIFALQIVVRLLITAPVLLAHAVIPWIRIPKYFHILSLSDYLYDCDYKTRTGRFP